MVNNSGAGQIDFNGLVCQNALADLGELLAAPSLDIPGKTVKDTLLPGAVEVGSYDGKFLVLNYTYTVYGIWHSSQALRRPGLGVREDLGRAHRPLQADQGRRHRPLDVRRASTRAT